MRILGLDAALGRCSAAILADGEVLAEQQLASIRGQAGLLAPRVQQVLNTAAMTAADLDAIAVGIGPGSFTGLRAAIALAQGLAAGAGLAIAGVSVAEALAAAGPFENRAFWVAIDSRRGRVFLDRDGIIAPFALDSLPTPDGPVAIGGDAAVAVSAWLAARGHDVMLTDRRLPSAADVARAALPALRGERALRPAQPLYVDPPEAKLPAGGLRPPPLP